MQYQLLEALTAWRTGLALSGWVFTHAMLVTNTTEAADTAKIAKLEIPEMGVSSDRAAVTFTLRETVTIPAVMKDENLPDIRTAIGELQAALDSKDGKFVISSDGRTIVHEHLFRGAPTNNARETVVTWTGVAEFR